MGADYICRSHGRAGSSRRGGGSRAGQYGGALGGRVGVVWEWGVGSGEWGVGCGVRGVRCGAWRGEWGEGSVGAWLRRGRFSAQILFSVWVDAMARRAHGGPGGLRFG